MHLQIKDNIADKQTKFNTFVTNFKKYVRIRH